MPAPDTIAQSFRDLNFHDFSFVDLRILPAQTRGDVSGSAIEVRLRKYSQKELHSIRFSGCRNLRVAMDFDVLAGNLPPNTSRVDAHTDLNRIRDLMQSQKKDWDVGYASGVESPLTKKLAEIDHLIAFRIQFFGGAIDIIAQEYAIQML